MAQKELYWRKMSSTVIIDLAYSIEGWNSGEKSS